MSRQVVKNIESKEQGEGKGARVRRSIGSREVRNFDPFLLFDEAVMKPPAGFPEHPHRGFETVSYILEGKTQHQDFAGHEGFLGPGDLQWMTAGRGIVHHEMPIGNETCHGLQLWVNLSKANKMIEPHYQELRHKDIPSATKDGVTVKVIAGESMNIKSPVLTRTPTMYLDFKLEPNATFIQPVPKGWNALIFILDGEGVFGSEKNEVNGKAHHTLLLSQGESIRFANKSKSLLHFVLIAGQPLNEPIVQHGPFVMNTESISLLEEIEEAFDDYENCKNGFQNRRHWKPKA